MEVLPRHGDRTGDTQGCVLIQQAALKISLFGWNQDKLDLLGLTN